MEINERVRSDDWREPSFGSVQQRMDWLDLRRAARKKQLVRIAVSPGASFKVDDQSFNEGDEIDDRRFLWHELKKLEELNLIIRLDEHELAAIAGSNARFRVAEGQAVITRMGIVAEGGAVTTAHFEGGLSRIMELIERLVLEENPDAKESP